jgi:hypothetical protein
LQTSVEDALSLVAAQGALVLAVIDEQNLFAGIVTRARLEGVPPQARRSTTVAALVNKNIEALKPGQFLIAALEHLSDYGLQWLPVVTEYRIIGGTGVRDILRSYNNAVEKGVRRTQSLPEDSLLFEVRLGPESKYVGCTLREADLPANTLVVSIQRDTGTIFPMASTRLESGDVLTIMADPALEQQVQRLFDGLSGGA